MHLLVIENDKGNFCFVLMFSWTVLLCYGVLSPEAWVGGCCYMMWLGKTVKMAHLLITRYRYLIYGIRFNCMCIVCAGMFNCMCIV